MGAGVRRGMVRTVFLVLDCSRRAAEPETGEMRPSCLEVMKAEAAHFITAFFEQNPISTLALVCMKNGVADSLAPLSSNARTHLEKLRTLNERYCAGEASLQNALDLAKDQLQATGSFVSRELVLLSASLSTCDPGDIHATIGGLAAKKVRCTVVQHDRRNRNEDAIFEMRPFRQNRSAVNLPFSRGTGLSFSGVCRMRVLRCVGSGKIGRPLICHFP